jgi:hypothetical protein
MKKAGQKNTVELSVGELSKLPATVKVSVSVGWLNKYNQFAAQMGMTPLATDGEDSPETAEAPTKSGVGNISVG